MPYFVRIEILHLPFFEEIFGGNICRGTTENGKKHGSMLKFTNLRFLVTP